MTNKVTHALLGRFSPPHLGHQRAIDLMIDEYGLENCLVIVGSSNSRNSRTPYTFEQRRNMLSLLFPGLKIIGLPDIQPELVMFDGSTNEAWLDSIEKIEKRLGSKLSFCGGKAEDLAVLAERFETEVIFNRDSYRDLSATNVRKALENNDVERLAELVDPLVLKLVQEGYQEYKQIHAN